MRRILLSALVLASAVSISCTKKSQNKEAAVAANSNEILVGEYGSMTGSEATFGQSTHKGIELAFAQLNGAGGVNGKTLKLISLDDQGKSEEAALAVTRLITVNKVVAVLGEVASSKSLAAAPIAQQYKVPMISPSSTNPKVTEVGDFIFRVCFIDPFQGKVMAKFATENLKGKKFAIFRDIKSDYSVGLADVFAASAKEMGGEIVIDQSYSSGDIDFKAQLTKIREKKPDSIFVPGYYTEVGMIAQQSRQLGITVPLLGGDGWDSAKLSEIGKDAINGSYFSNHYTTESDDPAVKKFITDFKAKYNETPDGLAALGYDSAMVLALAIKNIKGEITTQAIRDELAKTKDFPGVTGKITINEKRDAVKSAVVVKVDGANNRYVSTVNP